MIARAIARKVGTSTVDAVELARARLTRLVRIDARYGSHLNPDGQRLLRRSVFESYLVLRDAGLQAEANALLARARS